MRRIQPLSIVPVRSPSPCPVAPPGTSVSVSDIYVPTATPASPRCHEAAEDDRTDVFRQRMQQEVRALSPQQRRVLVGKVALLVPGYAWKPYTAAHLLGYNYMQAQRDFCHELGMRVVMADVQWASTSEINAQRIYDQLKKLGRDHGAIESIVVIAHSHGTRATLRLLLDSKFADMSDRVHGFVALNGVFHGTALADLLRRFAPIEWMNDLTAACFGGSRKTWWDLSTPTCTAYNAQNARAIHQVVQRVSTLSVATSYDRPRRVFDPMGWFLMPAKLFLAHAGPEPGGWWRVPWRIWQSLFGAKQAPGMVRNDGLCTVSSQKLAGAPWVELEGLHHCETVDERYGTARIRAMTAAALSVILEGMGQQRSLGRRDV